MAFDTFCYVCIFKQISLYDFPEVVQRHVLGEVEIST